jgi:hypothetical protein
MRRADEREDRGDGLLKLLLLGYIGYIGYAGYLCMGGAVFGLMGGGVKLLLGIPLGIVGLFLCRGCGEILEKLSEKFSRLS